MTDLLVTCPVCDSKIGTDCEVLPDSHSPLQYRHDRLLYLLGELHDAGFIPEEFEEEVAEAVTVARIGAEESRGTLVIDTPDFQDDDDDGVCGDCEDEGDRGQTCRRCRRGVYE